MKLSSCTAFVAIVIVGMVGCGGSATPSIREMKSATAKVSPVIDNIFHSIDSGAFQELYSSATAPRFREAASAEDFIGICERVQSRLGKLLSKELSKFELNLVDGSTIASALYQAEFEQGAGTIFVVFEKIEDEWLLLRLNVNAPQLLDDPTEYREPIEVYVENSFPAIPGMAIDILDSDVDPPKVILENVSILNARWKATDPLVELKYPMSGFITVAVSKDQRSALEAPQTLSVREHEEANSKADDAPVKQDGGQ